MCRAVLQQLKRVGISTERLLLMLGLMLVNKGIHSCASWEVSSLHCSPRNPGAIETVSFHLVSLSDQHLGLRRHRQPLLPLSTLLLHGWRDHCLRLPRSVRGHQGWSRVSIRAGAGHFPHQQQKGSISSSGRRCVILDSGYHQSIVNE